MEYKSETEKVVVIDSIYMSTTKALPLADDPEIQQTRKTFIVILSILLTFYAISTIILISGVANYLVTTERESLIVQTIIAALMYGLGIFAAHRYSEIGLRIFAWVALIAVIVTGSGLVILLLFIIVTLVGAHRIDSRYRMSMTMASVGCLLFIIPCFVVFTLSVIIVKYAFKLVRLIAANKSLVVQKI